MRSNRGKTAIGAVQTAALVANVHKEGARPACLKLLSFLKSKGVSVIADVDTAGLLGDGRLLRGEDEIRSGADLVIAVGGDGTVLRAAAILRGAKVPLLGLNIGGLGFLTAAGCDQAEELVSRVMTRKHRAEERSLLDVRIIRRGREASRFAALNDAVIARGALPRLVALDTFIDDEYLATFRTDGLIISTPTGSTAYTLSAGGPLVSPDTDAIIITPICPHMLTDRPLIIPSSRAVRVTVPSQGHNCTLALDGRLAEDLRDGDEITIGGHKDKLTLIIPPQKSYFQLLRQKLHWGGRANHG